jgi:integrase
MKKNASKEIEFPLTLTERGVSTKIYRTTSLKNGVVYESFILVWQAPDGRQRQSFSSLDKAKAQAGAVMSGILSGRSTETLGLADAEMLKRVRLEADAIGRPALAILEEYAAAQKILAARTGLIEAALYWDSHCGRVTPKLIADAFAEFKLSHARDWSKFHARDVRKRGAPFVSAFRCHVHELDRASLKSHLDTTRSGSAWNKRFEVINAFVNWCSEKGYIADDAARELLRLRKKKLKPSNILVYTPAELRFMLEGSPESGPLRDDLKPWVILGAFAGVRPVGEFQRLHWEDIDVAERRITVNAEDSKIGRRRTVPLSDNLIAWLKPYAGRTGRIAPFEKVQVAVTRHCVAAGVKFKKNALRHSYGSYRLETTQDVPKVAHEMNNSVAKVYSNYRQLVKPSAAVAFWSLMPSPPRRRRRKPKAKASAA